MNRLEDYVTTEIRACRKAQQIGNLTPFGEGMLAALEMVEKLMKEKNEPTNAPDNNNGL